MPLLPTHPLYNYPHPERPWEYPFRHFTSYSQVIPGYTDWGDHYPELARNALEHRLTLESHNTGHGRNAAAVRMTDAAGTPVIGVGMSRYGVAHGEPHSMVDALRIGLGVGLNPTPPDLARALVPYQDHFTHGFSERVPCDQDPHRCAELLPGVPYHSLIPPGTLRPVAEQFLSYDIPHSFPVIGRQRPQLPPLHLPVDAGLSDWGIPYNPEWDDPQLRAAWVAEDEEAVAASHPHHDRPPTPHAHTAGHLAPAGPYKVLGLATGGHISLRDAVELLGPYLKHKKLAISRNRKRALHTRNYL